MTLDASEHRLRADAERNRRRLLDAAAAAFAEKGMRCSVDEVARRAGVGHATAFRHFPTKETLIAAVVSDKLRQVADAAESALEDEDPDAGLRRFLEFAVELHASDRCLLESADWLDHDSGVLADKQRTLDAFGQLVVRAQMAGVLRDDVTADDLLVLLVGITQAASELHSASPELWRRYLAIVLDGLRPGSASPLPLGPPPKAAVAKAIRARRRRG